MDYALMLSGSIFTVREVEDYEAPKVVFFLVEATCHELLDHSCPYPNQTS